MQIELSTLVQEYLHKKEKLFVGKKRLPRIVLAVQSCRGAEFRIWYDYLQEDDMQIRTEDFYFFGK